MMEKPTKPLRPSADVVQSSPMDTDIQERVAQINAFYAARRAERAAAETGGHCAPRMRPLRLDVADVRGR